MILKPIGLIFDAPLNVNQETDDASDHNAGMSVMKESDILLEGVYKSATGVLGALFDSDVTKEEEKIESGEKQPGGGAAPLLRHKRQVSQDDIKNALCRDKNPGEFFRLVAGATHCRDVVACADHGLQAVRCPPGLAFDLSKQTCEWRQQVGEYSALPELYGLHGRCGTVTRRRGPSSSCRCTTPRSRSARLVRSPAGTDSAYRSKSQFLYILIDPPLTYLAFLQATVL